MKKQTVSAMVISMLLLAAGVQVQAGSVVSWGEVAFNSGDFSNNDFVAIAAGRYHSLALKSDRSIFAWGRNHSGEANPQDGNNFVAIAAGRSQSLAIIELPPVELPMRVTPQALNCKSKGKWLKAHFVLAEGFSSGDVDTGTAAWIEPLGIESQYINVFGNKGGVVKIEIGFDRAEVCAALDSGSAELTVVGSFVDGQYFYGTDTIKVIRR
jgi:hypothetical protein